MSGPGFHPANGHDVFIAHVRPWLSGTAHLRRRIREYLGNKGVKKHDVCDLVLCIEEALTNAMKHSCSWEPVDVLIDVRQTEMLAIVRDRGVGCDTTGVNTWIAPAPSQASGRGLFLITRLMDDVELRVRDGLTVLMRKRRSSARNAANGRSWADGEQGSVGVQAELLTWES